MRGRCGSVSPAAPRGRRRWRSRGRRSCSSSATATPFPRRLFFDFGNGCVKNIMQRGILPPIVRDIFISHLHVDHYADLPYFMPFRAWSGGWRNGLRIFGPSGDRPETGTQYMVDKMHEMMTWHLENFDHCPIGEGYNTEVVEFDYTDDNGICLQEEGLTVRHWGRSHVKNGASAFRVDWEEADLSFVWTGDGRPDETTIEFARGVDVFVTEGQADLPQLLNYKYGTPKEVLEFTLDTYHTPYYAAGLPDERDPAACRHDLSLHRGVRRRGDRRGPRPLGRPVPVRWPRREGAST